MFIKNNFDPFLYAHTRLSFSSFLLDTNRKIFKIYSNIERECWNKYNVSSPLTIIMNLNAHSRRRKDDEKEEKRKEPDGIENYVYCDVVVVV